MRQRRWLELIKDYDLEILYHEGKANVVADALSRKSSHSVSAMTISKELQKEVEDFNLELLLTDEATSMLGALTLQPTIFEDIIAMQQDDPFL